MNARPCLSAYEIRDFVNARRPAAGVRHHVLNCAECQQQVSFAQRLVSAGADPIREILHELDDLFARLVTSPRHLWWQVLKAREFQRSDMVRFILTRVVDARLRDPRLAIDLAEAATAIVDALPAEAAHTVRFDAWMYSASLLRERAHYRDAESALARAEEASLTAPDPGLARASIALARALLCGEPDIWKPTDAEAFLDEAETVFAARGDVGRIVAVLTARAFLLFRSGDMSGSRRQFEVLLDATPITNPEEYFTALSNLMWVRVEMGEADAEVKRAVERLIEENRAIGRTVQVARARWMMGRINVRLARFAEAVESFRCATEGIADGDAAIRIGLDAAEALLLDGRHAEGARLARELASKAVALDQREPTRRRALTARVMAYLREAAQRQACTPDLVADLGRYIDRITRQRPFDFIPPMPLADM